ncbi:MAG TPA: LLM class flavin-dependent oxidoreductase [Pseudonocardia sp.]|jgi:alkanesulfonate monooxygenase SsuD/methylene tetrahydromethanopterin reductase-like flavin-dependent oxidoreductase (luciferase family)
MLIGCNGGFQNPGDAITDAQLLAEEIRMFDLAVDLGFDSVWMVEHHFTNYFISPEPLLFLTWFAGRHRHIGIGTNVLVLPWHDPLRLTENIILADNLTGGRLTLGFGRGLAHNEYEGFRVDLATSRERFMAYAKMILGGLRTGFVEADNEFISQPRVEIRPRLEHPMDGRIYAGTISPESSPVMAELGVGAMVVPQKPWPKTLADLQVYRDAWAGFHGPDRAPPRPHGGGLIYVGADADASREMAYRYMGDHYRGLMDHYGLSRGAHKGVKGYEFYAGIARHIEARGLDAAARDYADLLPWGTPDQVLDKLSIFRDEIGAGGYAPTFSYAGLPYPEVENSIRLFAAEVMPVLREWNTGPVGRTGAPGPALHAVAGG